MMRRINDGLRAEATRPSSHARNGIVRQLVRLRAVAADVAEQCGPRGARCG